MCFLIQTGSLSLPTTILVYPSQFSWKHSVEYGEILLQSKSEVYKHLLNRCLLMANVVKYDAGHFEPIAHMRRVSGLSLVDDMKLVSETDIYRAVQFHLPDFPEATPIPPPPPVDVKPPPPQPIETEESEVNPRKKSTESILTEVDVIPGKNMRASVVDALRKKWSTDGCTAKGRIKDDNAKSMRTEEHQDNQDLLRELKKQRRWDQEQKKVENHIQKVIYEEYKQKPPKRCHRAHRNHCHRGDKVRPSSVMANKVARSSDHSKHETHSDDEQTRRKKTPENSWTDQQTTFVIDDGIILSMIKEEFRKIKLY